jgi:hypothetical protein
MRNACAHARQDISFETPELVAVFGLMLTPETREQMEKISSAQRKFSFELCASWMFQRLNGLSHEEAGEFVSGVLQSAFAEIAQRRARQP